MNKHGIERERYWIEKGLNLPYNVEHYGVWEANQRDFGLHIDTEYLRNTWWIMPVKRSRDGSALDESNFRCMLRELGGESEHVEVHRFGHFACGWYEILLINDENEELFKKAINIACALTNYPVVDEEDFSELELEWAEKVWKNCYRWRDRVEYVREHESQFDLEYRNFSEIMSLIRGECFFGYASELLR